MPTALIGTAYSQTLTATGTAPLSWTVIQRRAASGLTLGSSTGIISGMPTALGVFTSTVSATNAGGRKLPTTEPDGERPVTPPSIGTTSPLPSAADRTAYSQTLTATGTTPMTWTVTSGALPSGLTLGSSTGAISGMPTALAFFTLTVTATANVRRLQLQYSSA